MDFAIHDTDSGNPHCHIMLTMRPLDERGAWAAKSKKEYDLDENGERIRLALLAVVYQNFSLQCFAKGIRWSYTLDFSVFSG